MSIISPLPAHYRKKQNTESTKFNHINAVKERVCAVESFAPHVLFNWKKCKSAIIDCADTLIRYTESKNILGLSIEPINYEPN